ncbi:MAG: M20 family metallopeptidase [bacterium]|nr:M20 family metallopeptidase [bacterium]
MTSALIEEVLVLTEELIRIPSENPTGNESAMADRLETFFHGIGVSVERDSVEPGRENLTAEVGGPSGEPALVFLNHMDTVPAGEGWTKSPFAPLREGGRIWGRGACDMKGGLAAALIAFKFLKKMADGGAKIRRPVRCCLVVDEESPWMRGAASAVTRGRIGPADIVLSCEPTNLHLMTAQKGAMWYEIFFTGKSAHAAAPHMGADAIYAAAQTIITLQDQVDGLAHRHPELGKTTVVASVIEGGRKTNIVADRCRVEVDVRFVPPLKVPDIQELVEKAAAEGCAAAPGTAGRVAALSVDRPPILSDAKDDFTELMREAYRDTTGEELRMGGVSYYSDAGLVAAMTGSRRCFLFGPGNIEQAHAPDEFIETAQLETSARILVELVERFSLGKK